jgi:hypothetical protein
MTFVFEALACLTWFTYGSFYEWFIHRHFMHARRFPLRDAFEGHTLLHHQIYRGDDFLAHGPGRPPHLHLRPYTFPAILFSHLPLFILFEWLTGLPTLWGAVAGCTLYYIGFEYMHYLMHAPRGHFVERFRWFRFLREHHRLHHNYMRTNYNVVFPLADLCLGTLITTEAGRPRRDQRRRAAGRTRPESEQS